MLNRTSFEIHDTNALRSEDGDIAIGEEEYVTGVIENRGNIAGDEIFVLAEADDGGRSLPYSTLILAARMTLPHFS